MKVQGLSSALSMFSCSRQLRTVKLGLTVVFLVAFGQLQPGSTNDVLNQAKLMPNEAAFGSLFGSSVAVEGNIAVVGAPFDRGAAERSGVVYVYSFDGNAWRQTAVLQASDGSTNASFGRSVSIDNHLIAVGTASAVYLYRYHPAQSVWVEEIKLVRPPGGRGSFGRAVCVDGDNLIVGSPFATDPYQGTATTKGYAFFFQRIAGTWQLIRSFNTMYHNTGDHYGVTVDLNGDRAVVGAPGWGQVFVYRYVDNNWQAAGIIVDPIWGSGRGFGFSVGLFGERIVIGTPYDSERGNIAGAAYVYRFTQTGWTQEIKLLPPVRSIGARFGYSVAADGNTVAVGAPEQDQHENEFRPDVDKTGAAYRFKYESNHWSDGVELFAHDASLGDRLGHSIAVSNHILLAGAPYNDEVDTNTGAAYVFMSRSADVNGDGCVDDRDLLLVLFALGSTNPAADVNSDGTVDDLDILIVLFSFGNGC